MDKVGGKGRRMVEEHKTGLLTDERIWDDEELMIPVSNKGYTHKHDDFYRFLPLRTAVLVVSVTFSPNVGRLFVEIIRLESIAKGIINSGIAPSITIHARLQPLPNQFRYRTSSKSISKAEFNEKFAFDGFRRRDLEKCWFRFRLYSHRLMGRDRILGQVNAGVLEFEVDGIWSTLKLDVAPSEEVHKLLKRS
ncbi:hypothetical protein QZH41_003486 [Actinostola sp. cb2023]|nr:hypothetical protein QZH41_003486 [Actinostola sp. cb2023]